MEQQKVERTTIYDLEKLIERCMAESEKVGDIRVDVFKVGGVDKPTKVLVNMDNVVRHISMTIIGELEELEIIRKMGPMFRQFRSIERDFFYLDDRQQAFANLGTTKIQLPDPNLKKE